MIDLSMLQALQQAGTGAYNPNAPIPRPGQPTSSPGLLTTPGVAMQSQWNQLNGQLVGDTYLPPGVSTVDVGKGWYDVNYGGQRVGTLRPGGNNGRFINNTGWQMPQPGLPSLPSQPGGNAMPQPVPQPQGITPPSGPYGNQAMQMAGLLAQPQPAQPQPVTGGLLGGPKTGYRIPGGK